MQREKTMLRQPKKPYQQQGGCNRRVVNKGLSKVVQRALSEKQYREELQSIDDDYSLEGLFK